jgi:hypothetical protein
MTYEKPELTIVGNGLTSIQGTLKGSGLQESPGHFPPPLHDTWIRGG